MTHKENHGKVGRALYCKYTPEKLKERFGGEYNFQHGQIISSEELEEMGVMGIPKHVDESTKGDYECVCEFGIEVHYQNDYK